MLLARAGMVEAVGKLSDHQQSPVRGGTRNVRLGRYQL
jgi:hypothetical protein